MPAMGIISTTVKKNLELNVASITFAKERIEPAPYDWAAVTIGNWFTYPAGAWSIQECWSEPSGRSLLGWVGFETQSTGSCLILWLRLHLQSLTPLWEWGLAWMQLYERQLRRRMKRKRRDSGRRRLPRQRAAAPRRESVGLFMTSQVSWWSGRSLKGRREKGREVEVANEIRSGLGRRTAIARIRVLTMTAVRKSQVFRSPCPGGGPTCTGCQNVTRGSSWRAG